MKITYSSKFFFKRQYIHIYTYICIYKYLLSKAKTHQVTTLVFEWTQGKHLKIHMPYHNNSLLLYLGFITRTTEERKSSFLSPLVSFYQIALVLAVFAAAEWQFLKQFSQLRKGRAQTVVLMLSRGGVESTYAYINNIICLYSALSFKKQFQVYHSIWILEYF